MPRHWQMVLRLVWCLDCLQAYPSASGARRQVHGPEGRGKFIRVPVTGFGHWKHVFVSCRLSRSRDGVVAVRCGSDWCSGQDQEQEQDQDTGSGLTIRTERQQDTGSGSGSTTSETLR
ncbi:hypothetical protein BGX26_009132 [Mortierella sp. AD094]|nr:hypothetical protein BGX26_009132 [Mortierella sp. AD094]